MARSSKKIRVLFVCLGNICRSPMAEGLFRRLLEERGLAGQVEVQSAGTSGWHIGEPPDPRAQEHMLREGIDISHQSGRGVHAEDFERFDYIVAMDSENLAGLQAACPRKHRHKLYRCTDFAPEVGVDSVPDPYYGGPDGFPTVYRIIEAGARGLLNTIEEELVQRQ